MQLTEPEWRARQAGHEARVDALLAGHLARGRSGTPHPVEDFLFTYYSYRPAQLRRWHPGPDVVLLGARERHGWRDYVPVDGGFELDVARRSAGTACRCVSGRPAPKP